MIEDQTKRKKTLIAKQAKISCWSYTDTLFYPVICLHLLARQANAHKQLCTSNYNEIFNKAVAEITSQKSWFAFSNTFMLHICILKHLPSLKQNQISLKHIYALIS